MSVCYLYEQNFHTFDGGNRKYVERFGAPIAFRKSLVFGRSIGKEPKEAKVIDNIDSFDLWAEFYSESDEYDAYVCFGVLRFIKTKLSECPPLDKVKRLIRQLSLNPSQARWQVIKLALLEEDIYPDETLSGDYKEVIHDDRQAMTIPTINEKEFLFKQVFSDIQFFVAWYSRGQSRLFFESSRQIKGVMSAWLRGNSALMPASLSLVDITEIQARSIYRYLAVKMYLQWKINTDEFSIEKLMYSDLLTDLTERVAIYERHLDNVTERTDYRIESDWHKFLLHFKNPSFVQAVFNCLQNKLLDDRLSHDLPGLMYQMHQIRGVESIDQFALDLVPVELVLLKQLDTLIHLKGRISPRIENKLLTPIREALSIIKSWCAISRPNMQTVAEYTAALMGIFEINAPDNAIPDIDWESLLSPNNSKSNGNQPRILEGINGDPIKVDLYPGKEFEADWPAMGLTYPEYDFFHHELEQNAAYVTVHALEVAGGHNLGSQATNTQGHSFSGLRLGLTNYHHRMAAKKAGQTLNIPVFVAPKRQSNGQGLESEILCVVIDGSSSMFNASDEPENSTWTRVKKMIQRLYDRTHINGQVIHLYVAHDWGRQSIEVYPLNLGGQFDVACFDTYHRKGILGFRYGAIYRHFYQKYTKQHTKTKFLFLTDTGMQYIGWGYEKLLKTHDSDKCLTCPQAKDNSCSAETSEPDIGIVSGEGKSVAMYLPFGYGLEDLNHAITGEGLLSPDSEVSVWFLGNYNVQPILDKHSQFPGMYRWLGPESDDMSLISQW